MLSSLRLTIISLLIAATMAYTYDPNATDGPSNWSSEATSTTNQCSGSINSPIAFNSSSCGKFTDYKFEAGTCTSDNVEPELKDNVVEMVYPNSSVCTSATVQIPGLSGTYEIKQFHIHTLSEHTYNGNAYGAELHLVHQLVGGKQLSVIGIFIAPDSATDNQIFAPFLSHWEEEYLHVLSNCNITSELFTEGSTTSSSRNFPTRSRRQASLTTTNVYDLIPAGSTFYTYNGSLTTPPCTEGVWWNVADQPLHVSVKQFQEMTAILLGYRDKTTCEKASIASPSGSTSRPVQLMNGRNVTRVCPVGFVEPRSGNVGNVGQSTSDAPSIVLFHRAGFVLAGIVTVLSFLL